jgi:hypothetical protein
MKYTRKGKMIGRRYLESLLHKTTNLGRRFEQNLGEIEELLGVDELDGLDNAVMEGADLDTILQMIKDQDEDEPEGDLCDTCMSSGKVIDHTKDGNTVCVECSEAEEEDDGVDKTCPLEMTSHHCPKCGAIVMEQDAFVDHGEGEEAGRKFFYCSEACREKH